MTETSMEVLTKLFGVIYVILKIHLIDAVPLDCCLQ